MFLDYIYNGFSVITGKLGTDELEEPTIDIPVLNETLNESQYSSIDSIKEDEECSPPQFAVSKIMVSCI